VVRVFLLTDRRLLAGPALLDHIAAILAVVPRGTVAIQVREKNLDGGPLLALARSIIDVARPSQAPVWINDRLDVALAAGADGVHLPESSLPPALARELAPSVRIGCSRHSAADALAAARAGADLVQLGPIWSVPDKGAPLSPSMLRSVRGELSPRTDLVAVGGIDSPARAREVAAAGADAIAVIRAAWSSTPARLAALVTAVDAGIAER
jgi:thiamine-phosphate pyrophosphorylase